jgi:hypothetical protein
MPRRPPPAQRPQPAARWLPVTVTATSPLTVAFPDGSSHRGLAVAGLTYSTTSGTYIASHQDGGIPIVLPVA